MRNRPSVSVSFSYCLRPPDALPSAQSPPPPQSVRLQSFNPSPFLCTLRRFLDPDLARSCPPPPTASNRTNLSPVAQPPIPSTPGSPSIPLAQPAGGQPYLPPPCACQHSTARELSSLPVSAICPSSIPFPRPISSFLSGSDRVCLGFQLSWPVACLSATCKLPLIFHLACSASGSSAAAASTNGTTTDGQCDAKVRVARLRSALCRRHPAVRASKPGNAVFCWASSCRRDGPGGLYLDGSKEPVLWGAGIRCFSADAVGTSVCLDKDMVLIPEVHTGSW